MTGSLLPELAPRGGRWGRRWRREGRATGHAALVQPREDSEVGEEDSDSLLEFKSWTVLKRVIESRLTFLLQLPKIHNTALTKTTNKPNAWDVQDRVWKRNVSIGECIRHITTFKVAMYRHMYRQEPKEPTQFGSVSGSEIQNLPFSHSGIVSSYRAKPKEPT